MLLKKYLPLVSIAPFCILLWFVVLYGVNTPYWDQWDLISLFNKYADGQLEFSALFKQHNEHRIFFPKLIFITLAFATEWNVKVELYFSICLIILNGIFIYQISKMNIRHKTGLFHVTNIVSFILICSIAQYENLIWGFQISWFLVNTLLILSVFTLTCLRNWSVNLRQFVASLCCLVASFSIAYGLLTWIAIIPSLLSIENKTRTRVIRVFVSITLFLFSCILYRIGYQKPGHHPEIFYFLQQPIDTLIYFFVMVGAPIGASVVPAVIVGAIISISFLYYNIYSLKNSQAQFTREAAPWLSIGWFAILTSILITIGRAGFGLASAMSSRYTTVLILLIVSCLQMYRIRIGSVGSWQTRSLYHIAGVLFVSWLFAVFFVSKLSSSIDQGYISMMNRSQGKNCLEVIHFLDPSTDESSDSCLHHLYPRPSMVRSSSYLEKLGWRAFPRELAFVENPDKLHGYIDTPPSTDQPLRQSQRDQIELRGWAILPDSRPLPKTVFLSYGEQRSFFAHAAVSLDRPDVAESLHSNRYTTVGWKAIMTLQTLPLGETIIKAWVYDQAGKRFVKLQGAPKIQVVE